ncbi:capsule assembly Wzi family protein [Pseudoalteromonas luteoviolacea]|uniref:capsule assembly Wzi family protein n=1 Tax=Pseudoalteromonas luteoviolacea TaxID=43657 RepID=UPI001F1CD799|nr:capsule assembly Wzi family protein [Pseudoalteromonas luteoviolacea]MCF6438002.1 capsule assembly Wzi family protein [Pseudoalteromonas luteoviolacea]
MLSIFKKLLFAVSLPLTFVAQSAFAKPTAYLPIGKDNILEYQIEKMFTLTAVTPMSKPYRISEINQHIVKLGNIDPALQASIRARIAPYLQTDAITRRGIKLRIDSGEEQQIANDRGNYSGEYAEISLGGIYRGSDSSLLQLGAEYRVEAGRLVPYNTFYALGGENLQLNIGYKEHWFSPFKHSAQVYSTNAQTPLSISLGLNSPLENWWNFDFELFYSELEYVEKGIHYQDKRHDGTPKLAGTHLSFEPLNNWKIGINRMMQFGGGPREVSGKDVLKAFFDPAGSDNSGLTGSTDSELGDQWATVTTSFKTNWYIPVEWYIEHGGEDTREHKNYLFGNSVTNYGFYIPELTKDISLRYEFSDISEHWFTHHIYPEKGNSINDFVLGHFASNHRVFNHGVATQSQVVEVTYAESLDSLWRIKWTTVDNQDNEKYEYKKQNELKLSNSRKIDDYQLETSLTVGKDVFGENYTWLSVNVYW